MQPSIAFALTHSFGTVLSPDRLRPTRGTWFLLRDVTPVTRRCFSPEGIGVRKTYKTTRVCGKVNQVILSTRRERLLPDIHRGLAGDQPKSLESIRESAGSENVMRMTLAALTTEYFLPGHGNPE
jgi:hypothetical protein